MDILKTIESEIESINKKWGEQNHDLYKWVAILLEETGEVSKSTLEYEFAQSSKEKKKMLEECKAELIQVAAVSIEMIKSIERNETKKYK